MKKILITDGVHPVLPKGLKDMGYQIDYDPNIPLEEVRKIVGDYFGMIINSKITVDRAMLDAGKQLSFVGRLGSGLDIFDLEYAKEKNVAVLNSPRGNCNAVAEHALGMLLALANNLIRCDYEVKREIWEREKNRGFEIRGLTVGVIGFGHTGSSFAKKLQGMECRILAYDKYKEAYTADFPHVEISDMNTIWKEADIISFHLPLTPETKHLVNEEFIAKCKDDVIFINTSRGKVMKTADLLVALQSGKIKGACLDVFENEKPPTYTHDEKQLFDELHSLENVILSPHVAGWTHESKYLLAKILLDKIENHTTKLS